MTKYFQKRSDAVGLFWEEQFEVKEKKEKEKIVPPEPFWLEPDYLPFYEEAKSAKFIEFTDDELIEAAQQGDVLTVDCECYPNYFLAAFKSKSRQRVLTFELTTEQAPDLAKLEWVLKNFLTIGFNTINYDLILLAMLLAGYNNNRLKDASWNIIVGGIRGFELLKMRKIKGLQINHIDLIEVAPLNGSLKTYSGRLHCKRMQDLPFDPEQFLTAEQIVVTRWYCVNDLDNTQLLFDELAEQIHLRERMTQEYGVDLRSKSDAQIAEAVIANQVMRLTGHKPRVPTIAPGTRYTYNPPDFLKYQTPLFNWVFDRVKATSFYVSEYGNIEMPKELADLEIEVNKSVYRFGVGGLHSSEKRAVHKADKDTVLVDRDVVSFYPRIMLLTKLYPEHIGPVFLNIYGKIVDTRIAAKMANDKITADALKITINGTFGKLSSMYSSVYAPRLGFHVTITGQLSLLMFIERLELAGFEVVSANTDGVVFKCPRSRKEECDALVAQWEKDTGFETEETLYRAVYSRDVNSYIAIKEDGKCKFKGDYGNPWQDPKMALFRMHKNPESQICRTAVEKYLVAGTPLMDTIRACNDIREFVSVRKVSSGAVKDKDYLGKVIRWYYSVEEIGKCIISAKGAKVPKSDGAKPIMVLPDEFPQDVDYVRYEQIAIELLKRLGVEY